MLCISHTYIIYIHILLAYICVYVCVIFYMIYDLGTITNKKKHCWCSHEIPFVNPLFVVYVVCRCFILFFSGELCSTNGAWLPTHTAFPPSAPWETRTQQMSHRDIENISTLFSKLCEVIHIC